MRALIVVIFMAQPGLASTLLSPSFAAPEAMEFAFGDTFEDPRFPRAYEPAGLAYVPTASDLLGSYQIADTYPSAPASPFISEPSSQRLARELALFRANQITFVETRPTRHGTTLGLFFLLMLAVFLLGSKPTNPSRRRQKI